MNLDSNIHNLHQANRAGWNEGAQSYEEGIEERIEFLRGGGQNFCAPEMKFLIDLDQWCNRAIHLQSAGGTDTLSLWNRGAKEVIGIDISDRMIEVARKKSDALGAPATWIRSDILEVPSSLDATADLVYTGRGALCWIMDIEAWARVVARLLRFGGKAYIFEGHPVSDLWTMEDDHYVLDPEYGDYFSEEPVASFGWPTTYIGDLGKPVEEHATKYERIWRMDQIIMAILNAGLKIEAFKEHPDLYWDRFPNMPPDLIRRLPQTFSLVASKT